MHTRCFAINNSNNNNNTASISPVCVLCVFALCAALLCVQTFALHNYLIPRILSFVLVFRFANFVCVRALCVFYF